MLLSVSQRKLLSEFFSNMAVVWFAATFIGATNALLSLQYGLSGIFALIIALILAKEVN